MHIYYTQVGSVWSASGINQASASTATWGNCVDT